MPPQDYIQVRHFWQVRHRSDVPFSLHHSRRHMMLICLILMMLASVLCLLLRCSEKGPMCSFFFALARCWCSAWPWNLFVEDTEKPSAWVLDWLHGAESLSSPPRNLKLSWSVYYAKKSFIVFEPLYALNSSSELLGYLVVLPRIT